MKRNRCIRYIAALMAMATVTSCSLIDEDLDDCDAEFELHYELRLVTNMTTELETELNAETDVWVARALRNYLAPIFTDYAHDVNLSFYDVAGDSALLHEEDHIMNANQTSYSLSLPVRKYMHTATANVADNTLISRWYIQQCHTSRLHQSAGDTIGTHNTGIFSARLPMDVLSGKDQVFHVHLYMANCATALVVDTAATDVHDIRIYTTGFANDFYIADSVYTFAAKPSVIRCDDVPVDSGTKALYCSVNYPSPETPSANAPKRTRLIIETTEPFLADDASQALWQYSCYVTMSDGTVTESLLRMAKPLRAGQLKIIKAYIDPQGIVRTYDNEIVTSFTLDWKPGLVIEN